MAQGARLQVEVAREPFALTVLDADGTVLLADVTGLGWREDRNGRRGHTSRIEEDDCFYGSARAPGR